jgi:AcrR family transcriptional regulator
VSEPAKPLRADARKNRASMIRAAREVFAEHGPDAPLDLVARTAGVGRGTQHRHFPTRESLLNVLFEENFEQLVEVVRDAEPDEAYVALLRATVEQLRRDRGFVELSDPRVPAEMQEGLADRYLALASRPLRRAQRAGHVRRDIKPEDTLLLVAMVTGAARTTGRSPDRSMERALDIVLEHVART